jgi:hypothetical protein
MLRQLLILRAGIILPLIFGSSSFGQTNPSESQVEPDAGYTLGDSPPQAGPLSQGPVRKVTPSTDARRKKLIEVLLRNIGKLKPTDARKKSLDDFFVVGTADLNARTRDADVRFEVRQGPRALSEYLVDYVLTAPENTFRKWHVFSRHNDGYVAEQALDFIRIQFDASLAYQADLRRMYAARAMCRT